MRTVKVREARIHFAEILTQTEAGEVFVVTRRGHEIARIVPPAASARKLPSRAASRKAMLDKGARVTRGTVVAQRRDERW